MDAWMHGYMYKYVQISIYIHIYVCHKSEFVALEKKNRLAGYWGRHLVGGFNPLNRAENPVIGYNHFK